MESILNKVRRSLRIKNTSLDEELLDEMDACRIDLKLAGVRDPDPKDYLICEAIKLYCKAEHDFNGEGERYQRKYDRLKNALSLSTEYGGGTSEE